MPWLSDGAVVDVIGKANDGRLICEDDNGELFQISKEDLLDEPPTVEENTFVKRLEAKKLELRQEITAAEAKAKELKAEIVKLETVAPAVARVLKFMDGSFTHAFIVPQYGSPHIVAKGSKELFVDEERNYRPQAMKLISLFGASNGDLSFNINQYADGSSSGWYGTIDFFESETEAVAALRAWVAAWFSKYDGKMNWQLEKILEACQLHSIEVDRKYADLLKEWRRLDRERSVAECKSKLAAAEKSLAELA